MSEDRIQTPLNILVTGSLLENYNPMQEIIIHNLLDTSFKMVDKVNVYSHFIDRGISKVAYNWAEKRGMQKYSVAPQVCWEHPCRMVNVLEVYGNNWGDEAEKLIECVGGVIFFEETDFTEELVKLAKEQDKQVINASVHLREGLAGAVRIREDLNEMP
jgi:hypothetical protein